MNLNYFSNFINKIIAAAFDKPLFEKTIKLFKVKRFFLIDFKNKHIRGNHAHKKCKQFFVCLKGKKLKLF